MSPQRHQQLAVRCELSHGVSEVVGAKHRVIGSHRDAVRPQEQTLAPRTQEPALAIKDRDRMLATTENEDTILRIRSDTHDLNHVPVVGPAGPIDSDSISKFTGAENVVVIHRAVPHSCYLSFTGKVATPQMQQQQPLQLLRGSMTRKFQPSTSDRAQPPESARVTADLVDAALIDDRINRHGSFTGLSVTDN